MHIVSAEEKDESLRDVNVSYCSISDNSTLKLRVGTGKPTAAGTLWTSCTKAVPAFERSLLEKT